MRILFCQVFLNLRVHIALPNYSKPAVVLTGTERLQTNFARVPVAVVQNVLSISSVEFNGMTSRRWQIPNPAAVRRWQTEVDPRQINRVLLLRAVVGLDEA